MMPMQPNIVTSSASGPARRVSNVGDGVHRIAVLWWARQATGSERRRGAGGAGHDAADNRRRTGGGLAGGPLLAPRLMLAADARALCATSAGLGVGGVVRLADDVDGRGGARGRGRCAAAVFDPALHGVGHDAGAGRRARPGQLDGRRQRRAGGHRRPGPRWPADRRRRHRARRSGSTPARSWCRCCWWSLSRIPMPERAVADAPTTAGLAGGFRLVRADRKVRDLVVVAAGLNLCVAPLRC